MGSMLLLSPDLLILEPLRVRVLSSNMVFTRELGTELPRSPPALSPQAALTPGHLLGLCCGASGAGISHAVQGSGPSHQPPNWRHLCPGRRVLAHLPSEVTASQSLSHLLEVFTGRKSLGTLLLIPETGGQGPKTPAM